MYSLNKVQIIWNLTADPEVRETPNGRRVANFSVATSRRYTDSAGVQQDVPEFHNVVAWWRLAEIVEQYLKKGNKVYIEGRLETRSWEDQAGQKRYKTEIIASEMIMLTPKWGSSDFTSDAPAASAADEGSTPAVKTTVPKDEEKVTIEDVPF